MGTHKGGLEVTPPLGRDGHVGQRAKAGGDAVLRITLGETVDDGTVWIATASKCQANALLYRFDGDRQAVREATLQAAIEALLDLVESA